MSRNRASVPRRWRRTTVRGTGCWQASGECMSRILRGCSIGVVMLFLTSAIAYGQATAQLSGRVTDDSGGVLPGVSVTVVQTDTGFTRTTVTDDSGTYVLPNLPHRAVPARGDAGGLPRLRPDRYRPAGSRDAGDQRHPWTGRAGRDGYRRGGRAARGHAERRHRRGRRAGTHSSSCHCRDARSPTSSSRRAPRSIWGGRTTAASRVA